MELWVTDTLSEIDFAPENVAIEIMQNVRTIFSTPRYTVPLDRLFGTSQTFLDKPTPAAMARFQSEIIAAINKFEPRCRVTKVEFTANEDGKLSPSVKVKINAGRIE